ncbi:dUTP diphosphatase [Sharpea azabuensis]|uniref:dUTP diphosphatase n=1 Tax=Sharpea azabuensis TaxID=322505 RepID=UPI00156A5244|nr:dUTP diphosphatase [Sharpea azabuensis]
MTLKIKRLTDDAILPIRAHKSDAGLDLTCTKITQELNEAGQLILVYHTGLAVEIPEGFVGLLFQRSSVAKKSLTLTNAVGVIDSGYRGEILCKFRSTTDVVPAIYKPGERFAQLLIIPMPEIDIQEVVELASSDRGDGGYGSSDSLNVDGGSAAQDSTNGAENTHTETTEDI